MMKNRNILIVLFLILSSLASANVKGNQKRIDDINKQVTKNNRIIKNNNNKIKDANKSEKKLLAEINSLTKNISKLQSEYNKLELDYKNLLKAIGKNEQEIRDSIKKINESNTEIFNNKANFNTRLKNFDAIRRANIIMQHDNIEKASKSKKNIDLKIILDDQKEKLKNVELFKYKVENDKKKVEKIKEKNLIEANNVKKTRISLQNKQNELNKAKQTKDKKVEELKIIQNALKRENNKIESTNKKLLAERNKLEQEIQGIIKKSQANNNKDKKKYDDQTYEGPIIKGTGVLTAPIKGKVVLNYKDEKTPGVRSNGIEILGQIGQSVVASDSGTVLFAGSQSGLGVIVIIRHGNSQNSFVTVYGNLASTTVKKGSNVKKGQTIGRLGKDSTTKRPLLYFEVRKGVNLLNPLNYI